MRRIRARTPGRRRDGVSVEGRGHHARLPSEDMVVILQTDSNDFADNVFLSTLLRSD